MLMVTPTTKNVHFYKNVTWQNEIKSVFILDRKLTYNFVQVSHLKAGAELYRIERMYSIGM